MVSGERLTYIDFQRHLIFRLAVFAEADFQNPVYVEEAASHIEGRFPVSWIETITAKLVESGFLAVFIPPTNDFLHIIESTRPFVEKWRDLQARKEIPQLQYVLTEAGLEEAERVSRILGLSLWDEIDRFEANGGRQNVVETGRLIPLDRNSPTYIEVESEVRNTIRKIRSDNELMATPEGSQRVAELEAGKALIQADQVNEGLVKRTLVPSLLWATKKLDEGAGVAIKLAITKIFDLF